MDMARFDVGGLRRKRFGSSAIVAVTAVVAFLAVAVALLLSRDTQPGGSPVAPPPQASAEPTFEPTTTASPSATAPPRAFTYQLLWPFTSPAEAAEWQGSYRAGGHQPPHPDADQTALSFTTGFLGFTEIDRVIWHRIRGDDAQVAAGYPTEGGRVASTGGHLLDVERFAITGVRAAAE